MYYLQSLQSIPRRKILQLTAEFHISYVSAFLTKDSTGHGGKLCERGLIVVATSRQMCYSTAIERSGTVSTAILWVKNYGKTAHPSK